MAAIPEEVRRKAVFQVHHGPTPPPGHPIERIVRGGLALLVMPGEHGSLVEPSALADVGAAIEEARELYRARGKDRVVWAVPEAARPVGLAGELLRRGFEVLDELPFEPRSASMALVEAPPSGPPGIATRPAASFEDFLAAQGVADDAFEIPDDERRAWDVHSRTRWEMEADGTAATRTFLAFAGGELAGAATALLCPSHVLLVGGSVRTAHRGRGVYRALIRARWDAAVARGTPVLTVTAGRMSRPVLARSGFTVVGWTDLLIDRFGVSG